MALTSYSNLHSNVYKDLTADKTGELVVAGTPTLFAVDIDNSANSGAASYFKIYDKATAPTVADDPIFLIKVAAGSTFNFQPNKSTGKKFKLGVGIRCVTTAPKDGDTSPASAVVVTLYTD